MSADYHNARMKLQSKLRLATGSDIRIGVAELVGDSMTLFVMLAPPKSGLPNRQTPGAKFEIRLAADAVDSVEFRLRGGGNPSEVNKIATDVKLALSRYGRSDFAGLEPPPAKKPVSGVIRG